MATAHDELRGRFVDRIVDLCGYRFRDRVGGQFWFRFWPRLWPRFVARLQDHLPEVT